MPNTSPPGIIVLGGQRSGTSALTQALSHLGLHLPKTLVSFTPGHRDNPHGYFESDPLNMGFANPYLLDGGAYPEDALPATPIEAADHATWLPVLETIFASEFPNEPFLWKDPRLSATLPLARMMWGDRPPIAVLAVRNPLEIAQSINYRVPDAISPEGALATWERNLRSALDALPGMSVVVVNYQNLLDEPIAVLEGVVDFSVQQGLLLERSGIPDGVATINRGFRHQTADNATFTLTDEQGSLWRMLSNFARSGPFESFPVVPLGRESARNADLIAGIREAFIARGALEAEQRFVDPDQVLKELGGPAADGSAGRTIAP